MNIFLVLLINIVVFVIMAFFAQVLVRLAFFLPKYLRKRIKKEKTLSFEEKTEKLEKELSEYESFFKTFGK